MTQEPSLRAGEFVLGAFVLALGLYVGFETYAMGSRGASAMAGPQLFPVLIATGLVLVGLALLREAAFGKVAHEAGFALDWRAVAIVCAGLLLQLLLLERVGWIIATTAMFVAATLGFRERRLVTSAMIGLVLSCATFVVFNYGLGLSLPAGAVIEDMLAPHEGE